MLQKFERRLSSLIFTTECLKWRDNSATQNMTNIVPVSCSDTEIKFKLDIWIFKAINFFLDF